MNIDRLKEAEEAFLERYPGGFEHPDMKAIAKKHKVPELIALATRYFSHEAFAEPMLVAQNFAKFVTRSSLISVFEKPRLRDYVASLPPDGLFHLGKALRELFYGESRDGFEALYGILKIGKASTWPIMTVCPVYLKPQVDICIKPSTVKEVLAFFDVKGLVYKPQATWNFYAAYRSVIEEMKSHVDAAIKPDNASFSGFLMVSMHGVD